LIRIAPVRLGYGVVGITTLDRDVVYDDGDGPITYYAAVGYTASNYVGTADFTVDNAETTSLFPEFDIPQLTEADINERRARRMQELASLPEERFVAIIQETNTREAFLYNDKRVPELLAPLGVDRYVRGYYHTIEKMPRRFTFSGGVYTEVLPYETVDADIGSKAKLRTAYLQAPFTESFVFLPTVFSFVVPNAITSVGSGTSFEAQNYIGELKWHNEYDRQDNPDRNIGHYRAVMKSGLKPGHPQFGYAIIHLRCPDDLGLTACASTDGGDSSDLGSGDYFAV
jgi:hypothetical protein